MLGLGYHEGTQIYRIVTYLILYIMIITLIFVVCISGLRIEFYDVEATLEHGCYFMQSVQQREKSSLIKKFIRIKKTNSYED